MAFPNAAQCSTMIFNRQHTGSGFNDFRVVYLILSILCRHCSLRFKRNPSGPLLSPNLIGGSTNSRTRSHPRAFDKRGRDAGGFDPQGKSGTEQATSTRKEGMCTPCTTLKQYKLYQINSNHIIRSQDGASLTHDCRPVLVVHALAFSTMHTAFTC